MEKEHVFQTSTQQGTARLTPGKVKGASLQQYTLE